MSNPWDERYASEDYAFGTEPNDFLRAEAGRIARGNVLCMADGEGRNGVYLAGLGHAVLSVDLSSVGLQKAEKLAAARGVQIETRVADLAEWPIEVQHWDGIVSIFCHMPSTTRAQLHQRVVAGLKPGGVFILEAYTPDQLAHDTGGPSTIDLLMNSAALEAELAGLDLMHNVQLERDVVEGSFHTGRAAVVQVVGIKPSD